MVSSIDETNINVDLTPPPNTNEQDNAGGTTDKTHDYQKSESEDSRSETDFLMKNVKMKKITITLTLHLKKKIQLNRNYKKKPGVGYYPIFSHSK